ILHRRGRETRRSSPVIPVKEQSRYHEDTRLVNDVVISPGKYWPNNRCPCTWSSSPRYQWNESIYSSPSRILCAPAGGLPKDPCSL
ncbi:hypothetical protein ARMGADRAFT_1009980, partial [Armillaria gallica]